MRPFWHPLSALYLADPRVYASPTLIRMLLQSAGNLELFCGGDRMWPADDEPCRVTIELCPGEEIVVGDVVVATVEGRIADLLRVTGQAEDGNLLLRGDSDPAAAAAVDRQAILGRVRLPRRQTGTPGRALRRLGLDLREALGRGLGGRFRADPAVTVLEKYDIQAPFYVELEGFDLDPDLLDRIRRNVTGGGSILVVGSGSGRECYGLARAGYRVRGIDFAPAMIEHARRGAEANGLQIEFLQRDIRDHSEPSGSLDAVIFSYDVFSFLPDRRSRIELLDRMNLWLATGGTVFLSARAVGRAYERFVLTLQWIRGAARGGSSWGDSHTRYLAPDGTLGRSFVHYFTTRRLRREVEQARMRLARWAGGHVELRGGD